MTRTYYDDFMTPIGRLRIVADDDGYLRQVWFQENRHPHALDADCQRDANAVAFAREQLLAYFAGDRQDFQLPLRPTGTAFQCHVWTALADIPFGETISYAELARRIGQPKAIRAVGAANGRNPLPIVLPCHRVIGSDGSLTGFGGGISVKRWLLSMESRAAGADDLFADAL